MKIYKASLKLHSPLGTPLKGDTIWGHIVWGIMYHEGAEKVKAFLDACREGSPPLVVSSAFPAGLLPKPLAEYPLKNAPDETEYAQIKINKKIRYIHSFLEKNRDRSSEIPVDIFRKEVRVRNIVDRLSGSVGDDGLFSITRNWVSPGTDGGSEFDLYLVSNLAPERILTLLIWAFERGYGADASIGNGVISVGEELGIIQIPPSESRRYLALGPFMLGEDEMPDELFSDVFIRRGKLGGGFSATANPFKKTLLMFDEGATFNLEEYRPYIGTLIPNVHSDGRICHSGFTPIIPLPAMEA